MFLMRPTDGADSRLFFSVNIMDTLGVGVLVINLEPLQ